MKFLCLAYGSEKDWNSLNKSEQDTLLAQDEVLRKRGTLMAAVRTSGHYRPRLGWNADYH
jgi:hypothetical protein